MVNCNQEQLILQLEVNKSIFNEQQEKYIVLQKEYSQIVIDYEKRIRNLEMHYLEQSKQQKIQIQSRIKVMKDNTIFEIQLSRRQSSQPQQVSEIKSPNKDRLNFNTQNSPDKNQSQLIQDDTTNNLREDIKKRLAYLKLQMDQQN